VSDTAILLDGISVVVKGRFNAAIFSPLWLLQQNLIGVSDFTDASIEVITNDFASFSTPWLMLQVLPDALQLTATDPAEFERVRDVAVGVLNALPHTPVAALGINRQVHFAANNSEHYHAIGDQLVPKAFWENLISLPVTRSVTVWGQRPDNYGGRVQIQVEPSVKFRGHVYVAHNDHFDLTTRDRQPTTRDEVWLASEEAAPVEASAHKIPDAIAILNSSWASSIKRSTDVVNALARIE
jgi:hypothetical protein